MAESNSTKLDEDGFGVASKIELLITGKFSDFTIHCSSHDFRIHRAIVYGKSRFFDALIDGAFKESEQFEASLSDEPAVLAVVLYWVYTGQYALSSANPQKQQESELQCPQPIRQQQLLDLTPTTPALPADELTSHLKVYEAADRRMLPKLASATKQSFQELLRPQAIDDLRSSQDFATALTLIYQESLALEGMRPFIAWTIAKKMQNTNSDGEEWRNWSVTGRKIPEFVWDLLVEHTRSTKLWQCTACCQQRPFHDSDAIPMLIVRNEKYAQWLKCTCELRGFCSRICEAVDPKSHSSLYCGACRRSCSGWSRTGSMKFGPLGKLEKCAPFEIFVDKSHKITNWRVCTTTAS